MGQEPEDFVSFLLVSHTRAFSGHRILVDKPGSASFLLRIIKGMPGGRLMGGREERISLSLWGGPAICCSQCR